MLFASVIYLLCIGETEFEDLFGFELSPLPTSLCNEMSKPRYTKAKLVLQTKLKVETLLRLVNFNVIVIDGVGTLHGAVNWPKVGTVADLIDGVKILFHKITVRSNTEF